MELGNTRLFEVAWEVCNQVGGIYTVIRSKVPQMTLQWGSDYCAVGPYTPNNTEFEEIEPEGHPLFEAVKNLRNQGIEAYLGYWLVTGKPLTVLINPYSLYDKLGDIKYEMWQSHHVECKEHDELLDRVIAFGYGVFKFFEAYTEVSPKEDKTWVTHIHEWMAGVGIPFMRESNLPFKLVFTTHATLLGRYLAMNDPSFYDRLPFVNWEEEAKYFNVEAQAKIERAAAHGSHVMTTVSEITGQECQYLLGRAPDEILPNGLNVVRYEALHEFQGLHLKYKEKIHDFVRGHFFPSYSFELVKTLYFFTSGRFEYKNKGFDVTLEALARLNGMMKEQDLDVTIVMFFITKKETHSINVNLLHSRAVLEELRDTCQSIQNKITDKLFSHITENKSDKLPNLNGFIDDYWDLRYKRTLQSWKTDELPPVVTHQLYDEDKDEIMNSIKRLHMFNNEYDKVKLVYHPDFISSTSPLFHMDYGQFVRGCHLGVFPSYYEPWGYTPLECLVRGVPSITSDLSGYGDYVLNNNSEIDENRVSSVVKRKHIDFYQSAQQTADEMLKYVQMTRRERIQHRNEVESYADVFDWKNLIRHYKEAYKKALV